MKRYFHNVAPDFDLIPFVIARVINIAIERELRNHPMKLIIVAEFDVFKTKWMPEIINNLGCDLLLDFVAPEGFLINPIDETSVIIFCESTKYLRERINAKIKDTDGEYWFVR